MALLVLVVTLMLYVGYVNRESNNMTVRQKLMKAFYPALMWFSGRSGNTTMEAKQVSPPVSVYTINLIANNGASFSLDSLKGKKLVLVNTASDCGYTGQLGELEKLYKQFNGKVVVMGFPSNDFKEQEKGTDEEIAAFCTLNYGVSFPIMKKGVVLKSSLQQPLYQWLSNKEQNGWNDKAPVWNFSKYIVDEKGFLTHVFGPSIDPLGAAMQAALK